MRMKVVARIAANPCVYRDIANVLNPILIVQTAT